MGPIVTSHIERYPNLRYIAQENETLRLLLWHEDSTTSPPDYPMPSRVDHPLIRDDKTRLFLDPWPWLDYMRGIDFSFGNADPRQHRRPARRHAELCARPRHRTLELARYFEIPHREMHRTAARHRRGRPLRRGRLRPDARRPSPSASGRSSTTSSATGSTTSSSPARTRPLRSPGRRGRLPAGGPPQAADERPPGTASDASAWFAESRRASDSARPSTGGTGGTRTGVYAAARRCTSWHRSGTCGFRVCRPRPRRPGVSPDSPQGGCAMRKPLLSLVAVALVAAACGSGRFVERRLRPTTGPAGSTTNRRPRRELPSPRGRRTTT